MSFCTEVYLLDFAHLHSLELLGLFSALKLKHPDGDVVKALKQAKSGFFD